MYDSDLDGWEPRPAEQLEYEVRRLREELRELQNNLREYHSQVEAHLGAHDRRLNATTTFAVTSFAWLVGWYVYREVVSYGPFLQWLAGYGVAILTGWYYSNEIDKTRAKSDFPWWRHF